MPYVGQKPADIISTAVDTVTGAFSGAVTVDGAAILNGGIDVAGDITLDVDGEDIKLLDAGTQWGQFSNSSTNFVMFSPVQDKDIIFKGKDGSDTITALTLDMSDAGTAKFNHDIKLISDSSIIHFGADSDVFLQHSHNDGLNLQRSANGNVTFNMRRHDSSIADNTILASINASTPNNSSGTDALLVAAGIDFRAGANFAADKNAGEVDIKCANSETAATVTTFKRNSDGSMEQINIAGNTTLRTAAAAGVYGITLLASDSNARFDISRSGTSSASMARFGNSNGFIGSITTSGTATAYNTSSDYRLKENVNYDWDGTTELKKLKPAKFNFKADTDTTVQGFLAHEVSSIVPEAITGDKDATNEDGSINPQGIDQSKLVPLLTKALQEQQATIEALTARIVTLENA